MITLQEISPSPLMREYVRFYHYNELLLGQETLFKPLPARPEQCVQFSFRDAYQVIDRATGNEQRAPGIVIQGRQTERYIDLSATGHVITFTIHFQPTGFFRLFHIPLPELTNLTPDGLDVVGPEMNELYEQLGEAKGPVQMAQIAECYLLKKLDRSRPFHPIQQAALTMQSQRGIVDLSALIAQSNTSLRQFERSFAEQVGVTPKLYSRLLRFSHALERKHKEPLRSWTEIAQEVGYYDQMHLIHDCKAFADETPSSLMQSWFPCRK